MIIKIDQIPEQGRSFEGAEPANVLAMEDAGDFRPFGPLEYDLYVQIVDEVLIVRGKLSAELQARCARCTQIFSTTVSDSGFLRDYSELAGVETVDITEDLREGILLNLPRFPLCDEACKGLCMRCGQDLNARTCECAGSSEDGAWDALDNLKL
jgi:uncharacterized protein